MAMAVFGWFLYRFCQVWCSDGSVGAAEYLCALQKWKFSWSTDHFNSSLISDLMGWGTPLRGMRLLDAFFILRLPRTPTRLPPNPRQNGLPVNMSSSVLPTPPRIIREGEVGILAGFSRHLKCRYPPPFKLPKPPCTNLILSPHTQGSTPNCRPTTTSKSIPTDPNPTPPCCLPSFAI